MVPTFKLFKCQNNRRGNVSVYIDLGSSINIFCSILFFLPRVLVNAHYHKLQAPEETIHFKNEGTDTGLALADRQFVISERI